MFQNENGPIFARENIFVTVFYKFKKKLKYNEKTCWVWDIIYNFYVVLKNKNIIPYNSSAGCSLRANEREIYKLDNRNIYFFWETKWQKTYIFQLHD